MSRLYCSDIEGDGLLDDITKVWCASFTELDNQMKTVRSFNRTDQESISKMFTNEDNILVMHNGVAFDKPAIEKIYNVKVKAEIVDTLYLSWYLYPKTVKHGLAVWGEELGIAKPEIDDWENLTLEEYVHRCEEDVRIQVALWRQIWKHLMLLYGNEDLCWKAIRHLNFKAKCAALQEKAKWKLRVKEAEEALDSFEEKILLATSELEINMPQVPIYKIKSRPKKPYKANGDLSAIGKKWLEFCIDNKLDFDDKEDHKYISGYKDPNAGSSAQIKSWLETLGWVPESFKFVRDKETNKLRKIPQVKNQDTNLLCDSITRLISKNPELKHLEDLSILKHRHGVVNGLLKNVDEDGFVYAAIQGLTNTLRFKHRVCVNLPSGRKPYGKLIRGLLMSRSNNTELCGSDMSSLEDRTKQHYMWVHDPKYVKEMQQEGFDPHCDIAKEASIMTNSQVLEYKAFNKDDHTDQEYAQHEKLSLLRHAGKSTNYAATYGATGPTLARAAGVSEDLGDTLHAAYWKRNWSLTAIADGCIVKTSRGMSWLWNPVAQLWVYLKNDKDRFSTLNQSTGTYCFDRWLYHVLEEREQLTAQFHDEGIWELKKGFRDEMTKILKGAINKVNEELKLNRDLDCDVEFGDNYSEIH